MGTQTRDGSHSVKLAEDAVNDILFLSGRDDKIARAVAANIVANIVFCAVEKVARYFVWRGGAPKNGEYLVRIEAGDKVDYTFARFEDDQWWDDEKEVGGVTHWMYKYDIPDPGGHYDMV